MHIAGQFVGRFRFALYSSRVRCLFSRGNSILSVIVILFLSLWGSRLRGYAPHSEAGPLESVWGTAPERVSESY